MSGALVQPRGFEVRGAEHRRGALPRVVNRQLELSQCSRIVVTALQRPAVPVVGDWILPVERERSPQRRCRPGKIVLLEMTPAFEREAIGLGRAGIGRPPQPFSSLRADPEAVVSG